MKNTIIFLSGLAVPKLISKSRFVWDDSFWEDYNRIYITSRIPTSDAMVEKELDKLSSLINKFPNCIVAGHSLGAWWASNLACYDKTNFKKLVMLTPLGDITHYPIFNATQLYHPWNVIPKKYGPKEVLINIGSHDLIVPGDLHADKLVKHFNAAKFNLLGGHLYQTNHEEMLQFVKKWIES